MQIYKQKLKFNSNGENDIINITELIELEVSKSKINDGIINLFVIGSTAAITTIEYESGCIADFRNMLERIAPKDLEYKHELRWHDDNGHSHLRASLLGPNLTIPLENNQLILGTWQQIIFVELDTQSRNRLLDLTIIGK
tara:strand:+ start:472 stop:891 length:420 start_codon:yes stop_codon:yes gene_type:complete